MPENKTDIEKYASVFSRMIKADTTTRPPDSRDLGCFYAFRDLLSELFPHIISACSYEDFDGCILYKWKGKDSGKKPALFMYHHDVVPADASKWSHHPFGGDIADGKLWGRGTLDTKCGLWGVLTAADELCAGGFIPDRDIYFVSTRNEESSGIGSRTIAAALNERGIELDMIFDEGGFILPDPIGGADGLFAMTAVCEKTPLNIRFSAKDAGGHASMPRKNTALVRLSRFILYVEKHDPFPADITDIGAEMLRCFAPYMKKYGFLAKHPKFFSPILKKILPSFSATAANYIKTTLAFTMAGGSSSQNVLPTEAFVIGNMRVAPPYTQEQCIEKLQKICDKFGIIMEYKLSDRINKATDYRCDAFELMKNAILKNYDNVNAVVPYIANAATDCGNFVRYCDKCIRINPFIISKAQRGTIHSIDENIDVSTLAPAVACFKDIIINL